MTQTTFSTKAHATRSRILSAASRHLWARGYYGLRMDEVAADADVNKATIYRYFDGKEDLCRAVLQIGGDILIEHIFEHSSPVEGGIETAVETVFEKAQRLQEFVHSDQPETFGVFAVAEHGSSALSEITASNVGRIADGFAKLLSEARGGDRSVLLARLLCAAMLSSKLEVDVSIVSSFTPAAIGVLRKNYANPIKARVRAG